MGRALLSVEVRDQAGAVQQSAAVTVYEADGTTLLAQALYVATTGASTLANPLITDSRGRAVAYVDTPQRAVVKTGSGLTVVSTTVDIGDDPGDVATAPIALSALAPPAANLVLTSNGSVISGTSIVNANVSGAAAIALSKLAAVGANAVLRGDGSGVVGSALLLNANVDAAAGIAVTKLAAPPKVIASASAVQSVPDAISTALAFTAEILDTDTMHDTAVNNTRLTATTAGFYSGVAYIPWAANVTGIRYAAVRHQGTTLIATMAVPASVGGATTDLSVPFQVQLAAGEYVEVLGLQTSTGALDVTAARRFSMARLGT